MTSMAKDQVTTVKDAVYKVQLALLEGIEEQNQLCAAGSLMSRSDYQDVVTERTIAGVCGYPLCGNPLPSERPRKGRYRISLKEHKVYDLQETYMYCSTDCVINSHTFAATLSAERCSVFNSARVNEILSLFKDQSFETVEVQALGKNGDLGFPELKIQEKTETKGGEVSLEDWIGASNAIEGYVPRRDRNVKPLPSKSYRKDFAPDDAQLNKAHSVATKDEDPEDKILSSGQHATSRTLPSKSDANLSFELLPSDPPKSLPSKKESNSTVKTKSSGCKKTLKKGDSLQSNKSNQGHKPKRSNQKKDADFFNMDFMSTIITQDEYSVSKPPSVGSKIGPVKPTVDSELSHESPEGSSSCASITAPHSGTADDSNKTVTRSSLKSSGMKKGGRTVTWADENNTGSGSKDLCEFRELKNTEGTSGILSSAELGENDLSRLASAEACASALSQAAEAIASGQTEVADAVSEAGVLLLAQAPDAAKNEGACETDAVEVEQAPLKWPKKSGISSTDVFDSPDTWFDLPPEGFSLTLSPFATMWDALFSWMTCSSLAYIYGKDDSLLEEFLHPNNGREYPRKVVLSDGRSSEIKAAMAGCLARAMPTVVEYLKLQTPLSTLEKGLTRLLETMSFTEALPAFRLKQWQVIVLLFLEALSVSRITGLAANLSSKRTLIPKVVDGAQMKMEDYEFLKAIVIPLGPQPLQ